MQLLPKMLVISIVAALTKLKSEAEEFKMTVLYQQCLNRLGKYSETSITEEELGEIPGFSEYVINEIKQKATDKRKAKDDENTDSRKKLKENENQVFKRTKPIQSLRSGDLKCKECGTNSEIVPGCNMWKCKNCLVKECLLCKKVVQVMHFFGDGDAVKASSGKFCPISYNLEEDSAVDNVFKNIMKASQESVKNIYEPEHQSGAYAILKALHNETPPTLPKEELKDAAQLFCRTSLKETGPSSAWKDATLLLKRRLPGEDGLPPLLATIRQNSIRRLPDFSPHHVAI